MDREATGDGVSAEEQASLAAADQDALNKEQQAPLSPREEKLEAVKAARKLEEEEERQEAIRQGLVSPDPAAAGGDDEREKAGAQPPASVPDGIVVKDGKWFTKLKVQGQEKLVPFEEVIRTAQKHEAADIRLQEASRQLDEAARLRRQAEEAAQRTTAVQQPPPGSEGADGEGDLMATANQAVQELLEGDSKKAAKLLAELAGRANGATPQQPAPGTIVTKEDVLRAVAEHQDLNAKREAVDWYRKNHADLANDPVLNRMVDEYSGVLLMDEGFMDGKSYTDVMAEAAKRARETVAKVAGDKGAGVTTREQRKGGATMPPPSTAARRPPPPQPQPKTRAQILEEARGARGR